MALADYLPVPRIAHQGYGLNLSPPPRHKHYVESALRAFPALREAWKLDTVLGGAFTEQLYSGLGRIAPRAAVAFLAAKDYAAAELALHTAEALGVHDSSTATVAELLAKQHAANRHD